MVKPCEQVPAAPWGGLFFPESAARAGAFPGLMEVLVLPKNQA
jgi:hypothetical protein